MSMLGIFAVLAYSCALIVVLFSRNYTEKFKWILWAILILLGNIADKVTP